MFEFMSSKRTFGIIITAIAGCLLPLSLAAEVFKIGGTGGDLGTMGQLARAYEKANPDVTIQVLPSLGSSGGVKAVLAGAIDLGLSARPMNKKEVAAGAVTNAYAKTPLVFTVPARHPQKKYFHGRCGENLCGTAEKIRRRIFYPFSASKPR